MQIKRIGKTEAHLVYELFNNYRIFYKQPSNIEIAKQFIQKRLENNESVIFVAISDETLTPVGFTQLYPTYSSMRATKNWILNDLYVDHKYRKQGIGGKLIQQAIAFATSDDATFVKLETAADNYTAQSLYEQIGFEQQNPETGFLTYRISIKNNSQ